MSKEQIYIFMSSFVAISMCIWNFYLQNKIKIRENLIDMLMMSKMEEHLLKSGKGKEKKNENN